MRKRRRRMISQPRKTRWRNRHVWKAPCINTYFIFAASSSSKDWDFVINASGPPLSLFFALTIYQVVMLPDFASISPPWLCQTWKVLLNKSFCISSSALFQRRSIQARVTFSNTKTKSIFLAINPQDLPPTSSSFPQSIKPTPHPLTLFALSAMAIVIRDNIGLFQYSLQSRYYSTCLPNSSFLRSSLLPIWSSALLPLLVYSSVWWASLRLIFNIIATSGFSS